MPQDKSLQMNQTIETAILQLQQSPTPEQLAHTLTVVRRCMQAGGQWIVAVEPVPGGGQVQPRVVTTADGASWWYAFTSFEEQMKSPDTVKSTFLADIDKLFAAAVVASAGAIGVMIPPSNPFVVYGISAQVSIGDLFMSGIVPGIMMGISILIAWAWVIRKDDLKASPRQSSAQVWAAAIDGIWALVMPLMNWL